MKRYAIYEGNMEKLEKKLTRIQNKCEKYGCEFHFEKVGEEFREAVDETGAECKARFVIIEAEGTAKINGWRFIGTVEHTEKGNIIQTVGGEDVPERYYDCKLVCEHCKTRRARKFVYIVRNEETGEYKMVGKSCLRDFTGGLSAEAVAQYTAGFESLIEAEEHIGDGSEHVRAYFDVEEYLHAVAETIRHFGYVKRNDQLIKTTAERATDYYRIEHGGHWFGSDLIREEMDEVGFCSGSEEAKRVVKEALAWLDAQSGTSTYMHNLKTACAVGVTGGRNLGLLASLFPTYSREFSFGAQHKEETEAGAASEWVGEIGERVEVKIESAKVVTGWNTEWGYKRIWKITGTDGNVYTWKTTSEIGSRVVAIKGTVKDHTEYRGVKQTELTRCKDTELRKDETEHGGVVCTPLDIHVYGWEA